MTLTLVVPILGPPAVGKTTLTLALGSDARRQTFRLRDQVPVQVLAATTGTAERLGWIDTHIVDQTLRSYLDSIVNRDVDVVLMDNFPGSAEQVSLLLDALAHSAPTARVEPIEMRAEGKVLHNRARRRRVCQRCEKDPVADPRIPARSSVLDDWHCGRCGTLLHLRRGDAPRLLAARTKRFDSSINEIRAAFTANGIDITILDAALPTDNAIHLVEPMLNSGSAIS
ncbi:hypothetical protein SAMN04244553_3792 [Nocardia amikacinitolerans]|uniref:Adenylate kinase n=1 Tax=Nocardia amikacinitolerans TaxID=756689 RepID=A0A285LQH8_9NOCA|nr:hypothetical protein [Nocardia amikacinitolerans]SNY85896.1 hypothetical protein SAMN04244553_3792 [Nocardia amikacinitolerans]